MLEQVSVSSQNAKKGDLFIMLVFMANLQTMEEKEGSEIQNQWMGNVVGIIKNTRCFFFVISVRYLVAAVFEVVCACRNKVLVSTKMEATENVVWSCGGGGNGNLRNNVAIHYLSLPHLYYINVIYLFIHGCTFVITSARRHLPR